jgi:hypothetical protein
MYIGGGEQLLNTGWVLETISDLGSSKEQPQRALWRVRFLQRKSKGHAISCMISLYLSDLGRLWAVGAGMDEHAALSNCLAKLSVDMGRRQRELSVALLGD